jgi:hypothetical protein
MLKFRQSVQRHQRPSLVPRDLQSCRAQSRLRLKRWPVYRIFVSSEPAKYLKESICSRAVPVLSNPGPSEQLLKEAGFLLCVDPQPNVLVNPCNQSHGPISSLYGFLAHTLHNHSQQGIFGTTSTTVNSHQGANWLGSVAKDVSSNPDRSEGLRLTSTILEGLIGLMGFIHSEASARL